MTGSRRFRFYFFFPFYLFPSFSRYLCRSRIDFLRANRNMRDPARQPRRESVRVVFLYAKGKTRRNNNNRSFMKDPFAPYIHLFLLFESLSFLLIQGSARILAGGLTQRKEATFCQQRGYFLVYGPATPPIPQIASPASYFDFLFSSFFFNSSISCVSLNLFSARRMKYTLAQSYGKFLSLEPPFSLFLSLSFCLPLSFSSH